MGGTFSIALYSADRSGGDRATAESFAELRRLDRMLSNYRTDSEWSEVNRNAGRRPVTVPRELFDLISTCLGYSRWSEGAFDITVGPLVRTWGFRDGSGRIPDDAEIRGALARVGYDHILLDSVRSTVRFSTTGLEMDSGGIAKGYAVDRIVEVLKRNGIERALVSAAGSSIYALGAPPGESGWRVRIAGPARANLTAADLLLRDESLSTSGTSGKSFRAGGRVFGHILDPRSGYPARGILQVSVEAPRALDSEAWTKACFINGRGWSAGHISPGFRVFLCEESPGGPVCAWLP